MLVVFVKVWLMLATPVACALPPVMAPTGLLTGFVHVYVVPAGTTVAAVGTPLTGVTVNAAPLQIVATCAGITGCGLTVTVTVNGVPGQPPDVGVTV